MKINTLFKRNKAVFSFEVFPPKKDSPIESVYGKLEEICALKPDFVSVTYGAGGSGAHSRTCEIAAKIKHDFGVESVAHLTCVNSTRAMIDETLEDFRQNGIENILALRGDYAEGVPPQKDFRYASELCAYIRAHGDFDVSGACYPEVHVDAADAAEDVLNLKKKVDAGAQHLISQLFFDNAVCRSRLASCPSPTKGRSSAWSRSAAQACRPSLSRLCSAMRASPRRCATPASPTRWSRLSICSPTAWTAFTSTP